MNSSADGDLEALHETSVRLASRLLEKDGGYQDGSVLQAVDREGWGEMVSLGWHSLLLPVEFGGYGLPLRYLAAVIAPFARHGAAHPLTTAAAEVPTLLLSSQNVDEGRRLVGETLNQGQLIVSALWDAGDPNDVSRVTTTWRRDGDHYLLDGSKSPVAYAALADGFVVLARSSEDGEPALFVVKRSAPGVKIHNLPTTIAAPTGALELESARISSDSRIHTRDVIRTIRSATDVGAALTSAELTVSAIRGLELTVEYVKVRRQFDRALGEFQAVHHHCADMYRDVESMRILATRPLEATMAEPCAAIVVSIAKANASRKGIEVLQMAHQLHGGVAFYVDYPLELLYRRSMVLQGEYGTAQWHRNRIARILQDND